MDLKCTSVKVKRKEVFEWQTLHQYSLVQLVGQQKRISSLHLPRILLAMHSPEHLAKRYVPSYPPFCMNHQSSYKRWSSLTTYVLPPHISRNWSAKCAWNEEHKTRTTTQILKGFLHCSQSEFHCLYRPCKEFHRLTFRVQSYLDSVMSSHGVQDFIF